MPGGGELYNAMQQKVVDGQENPLDQIYSYRMYEVQKYVTTDHHTYSLAVLIINNAFYESMRRNFKQSSTRPPRSGKLC